MVEFYKMSAASSVNNKRQKAYAYLKLGRIYYNSIKNFELAKAYYNSTISVLPKDEDDYAKIKQRQEILDDFVKQLTTIRVNDSLIAVSNLPQDSIRAIAASMAKKEAAQEKEKW